MSDQPTELDAIIREGHAPHGEEEHKKRGRRKGGHSEHAIRELNLTAMMDMMTIILVFLIKNFATDSPIVMDSNLQPPRSTSPIAMEKAVMVTITKKGLAINDHPLVEFASPGCFCLKGEDPNTPSPITQLQEVLDKQVGDMKSIETKGGSPFEGKILIVADEKTPYAFLMRVLYTAGLSQFSQYKLIVRSKEGPAKPATHE
jgi:biopolymer transport protein ExbD